MPLQHANKLPYWKNTRLVDIYTSDGRGILPQASEFFDIATKMYFMEQ
jgi:hypothetical protein